MSVVLESQLCRPSEGEAFARLQIHGHFMLAQAKAGLAWRKSADCAYELRVRRASRLAPREGGTASPSDAWLL